MLRAEGNAEQLNRSLKGFNFYAKEDTDGKSNYQLFLDDIIEFLQKKLATLEMELICKPDLDRVMRVFEPYGSHRTVTYRFSEKNKHLGIMVSTDGLTATQGNSYSNNIALIEPAVEGRRRLRGKRSIKLRVSRPSSWLSVGVAYLDPMCKASF